MRTVCVCRLCLSPSPDEVLQTVARVFDCVLLSSDGVATMATACSPKAPALPSSSAPLPKYLHLFPGPDKAAPPPAAPGGDKPNLTPVALAGTIVDFGRRVVRAVVKRNLRDAATILELYGPYEYLLSEAARLDAFLASDPTLEECDEAMAEVSAPAWAVLCVGVCVCVSACLSESPPLPQSRFFFAPSPTFPTVPRGCCGDPAVLS